MLPSLHICVLASFLYGCLMMVRNTHAGSATAWVISLTIARTLFVSTVRNWGTKPSCVPAWNCTVYVNITHIGLDIAPIRGIASLPPPGSPTQSAPLQNENQPEPAHDESQREPEQSSLVVQLPATSDVPPTDVPPPLLASLLLRILLVQWTSLLANGMLRRFSTLRGC